MESVHGLRNTFTNHCLWTQLTMTSMLLLLLNLKLPFCFFPEIYIFSVQTFDIYFCSTVNKIWVSEIYSFSLHFNFIYTLHRIPASSELGLYFGVASYRFTQALKRHIAFSCIHMLGQLISGTRTRHEDFLQHRLVNLSMSEILLRQSRVKSQLQIIVQAVSIFLHVVFSQAISAHPAAQSN